MIAEKILVKSELETRESRLIRIRDITSGIRDFVELTKPRLTGLILMVAVAGFCLGSRAALDKQRLLYTIIGIGLLASGIFSLNQYQERRIDGLMRRTENRPLPAGRLRPVQALWFGVVLSAVAILGLGYLVNPLSGWVALFTMASYLFLYTPLKTRSPLCTLVGALPGAMPPFLGWAAARGELGIEAWLLFSILFLWQYPHFLAIGWLYREDYARAGIRMLPVVEPQGKSSAQQIVACTAILLPVSLIPTFLGLSGLIYFTGALVLGLIFLVVAIRMAMLKTKWEARRLLLASVLYLPLLFGLMVLNPTGLELGVNNQHLGVKNWVLEQRQEPRSKKEEGGERVLAAGFWLLTSRSSSQLRRNPTWRRF